MRNDQILLKEKNELNDVYACYERAEIADLHIHEVINAHAPKFRNLLSTFLQEGRNIITLLTLHRVTSVSHVCSMWSGPTLEIVHMELYLP